MVDPIALIALEEHDRRTASARRLVALGKLPQVAADRELRPWKAIAVICRAPGVLIADVSDYRRTIVYYAGDGSPANYNYLAPESEARAELADDLCPCAIWSVALAKARDAALGKANNPERVSRARNLCILARALEVPLTLASCARPVAAAERKAA